MAWWLRTSDGGRIAISSSGVLLGRAPDSDLVLTDDRASRRHAMVYVAGDAAKVVSLAAAAPKSPELLLRASTPSPPTKCFRCPALI